MALSKETVDYVAHLSRIELTPAELEKLSKQLEAVLEHIDRLSSLDVSKIPPTSHILPLQNVLRPDVPAASLPVDKALRNAPDRQGNFFGVPKVIE
ncbi:MAG TPA: Asp-tRNA(Asn)/Glu-tRNA(Gln) amidotransferase subunit GatC [Candidatus Omnitrophota bacterium]|nr:Asp-tRNA(Asn)/Glu-tRNA(Gln) amidotransferase subunit GatC [Candidatus Omnitrophota bacterium]HRZ15151.1 Asp-tRNA(Asn)/Glu-tRNA(Gln) amidotransferase subunit GatC [Candidatus Omnitrophota bacterium]